jgi:hypothetical protein
MNGARARPPEPLAGGTPLTITQSYRQEVFMKIALVTTLAAAALLAGCKTAPELDYTDYAGEPVKSFYLSSGGADGWHAVSKDRLVVWGAFNKAYLLDISGYCPDLQFAQTIGLTSHGGTVDRFEKVLVGRDLCLIKEIRPIDTKQMKEDRKLLRKQLEVEEQGERNEEPKEAAKDSKGS